jgi:hypothetical protein
MIKLQIIILISILTVTLILFSSCATNYMGSTDRVYVSSEPSGCSVYIDDSYYGDTPMTTLLMNNRYYGIKVVKGDTIEKYDTLFTDKNYGFINNKFHFQFEIDSLSEKQSPAKNNSENYIELDYFHPNTNKNMGINYNEGFAFDEREWVISTNTDLYYEDVKIKKIIDSNIIISNDEKRAKIPINQIEYFKTNISESPVMQGGLIGLLFGGLFGFLISHDAENSVKREAQKNTLTGFFSSLVEPAIILLFLGILILGFLLGLIIGALVGRKSYKFYLTGLNFNERKKLLEKYFKH